jgi:1,4-alpha-glucan branching enzyme
MKRLVNLSCFLVLCVFLCPPGYAAVPSTRPGMGAIPYTGGTTFRVWAPNVSSIYAAGNFNNWSTTANPLASEGGGLWSVDVPGASVNQQYKYVMNNGTHWRVDPRARDVVNSTGNGIIVSSTYAWTPFTPPSWNDMVIYEMHIGTYNDADGGNPGTWQTAVARLNHLQSLGVNVVEVMPIAEFPGDYSLGYNPAHLFAPESIYGTPGNMRNFIEQCHQRDIAVLIDVVYNHLGPDDLIYSVWQFDGYSADPDTTGGIYFYEDDNRLTPWGDTRPNFASDPVRSYIRDNVMYWLTEFNMDGLRMDGTAYIRERDIGGPDIPEGWSLMQWINDEIDAAFPQKISIAEDMRDNEWLTKTTGAGGAGFDSQWDAGFHHKVVPALTTSSDEYRNMWDIRDAIVHLYNGWDTQRVIYTESHDEVGTSSGQSRIPEQIWPGNAGSYYSKKRSTLGAGILFTSPGIPMLFMGQEFLEDGAWNDYNTLDWTKDTTYAGIKLLYTHLISLRRNFSGLAAGLMAKNVNVFHVNNTAKVIAYHRWWVGGPGDDVVVVANFSNQGFTNYNIGMPRAGRWRVRFNSDWTGYDASYDGWATPDVNAAAGVKDGLAYNANVSVGRYSIVIFSQGTTPNLDGMEGVDLNDFALFAAQWQENCDLWDSCGGADFDMSQTVDLADVSIFVSAWLDDTL